MAMAILLNGYEVGGILGYVFGFVGLFVPYGLFSLTAFVLFAPMAFASLAFFFIAMVYASRYLNKSNDSLGIRILKNLLVLLVITFLVDIIRFTPFASWAIFLDAGKFQIGNF